ncbi:MAG TPA: SPOR domain-containing protein [Parvibaculum sp.]|jgi:cell division septation protein DedD
MSDGGRQEPGYGYEPEEDDYYTYDATDEEDEGRRRPIVVLAIIALIVVFAGVVFLAYKQGLKQGAQGNPPVIRADGTPSKVAPVNPGGMEIPHQDRSVYDRMSGSNADDNAQPDAEHLLPKPEEPMTMQEPAPATSPSATEPPPASAVTEDTGTSPVQSAPVGPVQMTPPTPPAATPTAPSVTETAPAATSGAGGYVAQLAAFRDEPSARAELKKLQKKFPSLAGLSADIQKADLGDKGIYYRLRAGYLDKTKAQTLCTELKAKGQACLVRPK